MESTLSLQKEVGLLESLSETTPAKELPNINEQITYLFSLFKNSMKNESWNNKKIQPVLMRLLIILDQKAFNQTYQKLPEYKQNLVQIIQEFSQKSSLFPTFSKQMNMFFSKKKFNKFQNAIELLGNEPKFTQIFQKSIEKEIEKDMQSLEKEKKIIVPGVYSFLSPEFISGKVVPHLAKILRKSMKNLSKIRLWLSKLSNISSSCDRSNLVHFLVFLESNLCDSLNKDESFQKEFFAVSQNLLRMLSKYGHLNSKSENAISKFLSNMISKLKSKRNDTLMVNFVETLLEIEGKQNEKTIKLIFDGFWVALGNTKGEDELSKIKKLFCNVRKLDNISELFKNLSLKMKDKKDITLVSPVIGTILKNFDFLKISMTKEKEKVIIHFNNKKFETESLEEFGSYLFNYVHQLMSIIGEKGLSIINSTPETVSANLMNCLSLIHNSYFSLISKINVNTLDTEKLKNLESNSSKDEILNRFSTWKSNTLNAPELKKKIINLLFKSNSILFRKSMVDNLNFTDCQILLRLFKLLGEDLVTHIQKKKLVHLMSLLVYELMSKLLNSPSSSESYIRGKFKRLCSSLDRYNKWNILGMFTELMDSGFLFNDLLLNEFTGELLLNGMFYHMVGGRFSLQTHRRLKKLFSYLKYERINIFEMAKNSKYLQDESLTMQTKVIFLLSLNEFDNESCSHSYNWESVINSHKSEDNYLNTLTNNFSQSRQSSDTEGSIRLGNLTTILNEDESLVDDLLERLLSDKGVFSRNYTTQNFCKRLLSLLILNDSKFIFHRLNWLLNVNNLGKLTRMNKVIKYIEMHDLELERTELSQPHWLSESVIFLLSAFESMERFTDYLQDFGYSNAENVSSDLASKGFPSNEEFSEERTGIFELCSELSQIEDNEDEQMAELELNSKKKTIIEKFCYYMKNLSLSLFEILRVCDGVTHEEEKAIAINSIVLLKSVQSNIDDEKSYMKDNLQTLFLNVYFLASRQNNVNELIKFFYHIKAGENDSVFIRKLEKKCESVQNLPEYYSRHLFEMFFIILDFLVEEKLSAKSKKNILTIVVSFLDKFPDLEKKIFDFLVNNINSFYFEFAFNKIDELLQIAFKEKDEDCDMLDLIFQNILDYQDYAREQITNIFCKNKELLGNCKLKISPISKLKLIFLSRDEDSNVISQSSELLKLKNLQFDMNSFIELSFEEMLIEFPTDTHDTFALIFKELYSQLNPSQKSTFIKELASTFEKISLQLKTLSEKYNRFESKLMMFPKILHHLVDDIKGNSFLSFFDSFNRIEESKMSKSTQACLALGRELIQKHSAELSKLISLQTRQMDPARPLITPIVFVAECAQVNPHLSSQIGDLQSDLEKLLIIDDKQFLTNLAKQLRYLIKFLKDPEAMYERLFANILRNSAKDKLMGHCYFIAGLLKGLGIRFLKKTNIIAKMQKIFDNSVKKDYKDIHVKVRKGCVMLSEALWLVFDRLFEPCLKQLLDFLLKFLGDTNEEVRTLTSDVMKKVMSNISEFGIKQILPVLMKGTTHKNSKIKRNSILALGSIANCGTKQLSKNLPKIVPQLTEATNDTNDLVNSAAKKSLSLILGTIKSPEVMGLRDVLIKSLSDPYKHNQRCLEAILKTKFKHALDGPSLSLIVPVALYGCKSLNPDKSKKMASQLIASMIDLVPQASDFLPHLDLLMNGLEENLKDLSSEVRAMAAKAFAALTRKFRNETGMKLLNQLKEILQGEDANSTERAGYAQAFAEVLYSLGPEMAKTLIPQALKLTQDSREHIRESFLSVFVYIPMVMGNLFIDFVPTTIEYVVESISHEKEKIRNLAIKSLKTVIQNYLQNDFQVLLRPLFEGCLDENENKKNSSLILLGDIIQMLFEDDSLTRDFIYKNYSRIFSLFYIVKNDESSLMRETAKNIYKTFIPNTQRCLRIIFKDLHHCFIELFSREKDSVHTLARNGLIEFGNKFADTFASEMLLLADDVLRKRVTRHSEITSTPNWKDQLNLTREISKIEALLAGQSRFIAEFVANCNNHALRKVKNLGLVNVNDRLCNFEKEIVWNPAFVGLRTFVDRENKVDYIKTRLTEYSKKLSENEYQFKNSGKETEKTTQENDKMKKFFTILLQSRKEIILKETTSFLFTKEFSEWQFEVILQNLKLFGNLLYENGPLKSGLDLLFDSYNKKLNQYGTNMTIGQQEFLTMNKFTLNTLSVNIDPNNILILIQEFEDKLKLYSNNKNGPMIVVTLQSLSYFFEKSVLEDIQFPFTLCAESLRLIAFQGSNQKEIFDNVGAFLEIMFRFYNKENCTEIMTGIYNTLKEIVTNNDNYQGLENMKVIHCLFSLINQVIRYSTPESTLMALKTAKFMVKTLPKELLEKDQRNLYSALLRLLIYQYTPRKSKSLIMKKKLFSFMNFLLEKEIDMGSLCHQFFIYLVMLMNSEYKKEQENKKEDEEQVVNKEEVTENVMNEEEDKDEKTIKKKTMQKMTLREVYMDYTLNLGKYFKCTMGYLSSWKRKVDNDATYYHKQPFTDFLNLVKQQPEDVVSSTVKADIQKILG